MKNLFKKLISYSVAFLVFVQFSFMAPQRAQAGSLDTVKTVLGLIESALGPSWPLPIKATEIFALIALIEKCPGTNDEALQSCITGASNDPLIGPMLETSAGLENIQLGLDIYLDIKNSDYVKLIKDGGKPIGCAAAAIFTGFDVCGALDELLAIAGAVGEAAEYAFSWLDDLDTALFGQTPHMNQEQYFSERWKPYIRSYAALLYKGSASDDAGLQPYLSPYHYNNCGGYIYCGLENRSLNKIYENCNSYYQGFNDGNGGSICNNNKATFINQAKALVQAANLTMQVAPILQTVLDGQNKIWNDKLTEFKESLKTTFPEYKNDVLDKSKYDKYYWDKYENFTKSVEKKVGKITAGTYCADTQTGSYECIDVEKGDGTCCGTIAAKTYSNLYDSNFKTTPLDAANQAVGSAQEILQNYFKWLKADIEHFWQMKRESENSWKKQNFIIEAKNKLYALKAICKSLTNYKDHAKNMKFYNACYNSEPLESCSNKIDNLANQQVSSGDTKATNDFIEANKPAIDACLKASEKVTKEWQRMDNLYYPFIDGWYQYYQDNFKGNYKNKNKGEKPGSIPKEKMADSLEIEYTNCAAFHMEDVIQKAIDESSGKIAVFVGKPIGNMAKETAKAVARSGSKNNFKKWAGMAEVQPPTIAEGFCKDKGLAVVTHDYEVKNNYDTDGRDLNMKEEAKKVLALSGCTVHEFTGAQGKQSDEFHLMCDSKDKYDKCVKGLGGDIRPSKSHCTAQGSIATNLVLSPCCEATYQGAGAGVAKQIETDAKDLMDGTKAGMTTAVAAAAALAAANNNKTFKVTVSSGMGGSVAPMGVQTVASGKTATFTITASTGFKTKSVTGCGAKVKMGNLYETEAINADCTMTVAFEKTTLTIQGRPNLNGIQTGTIAPGAIQPHVAPASGTAPVRMLPIQPGLIKKRK